MRTGTFVTATVAAGMLGGVAGALLFLLFFAEDFRPQAEAARPVALPEPQFSPEEVKTLRVLPRRIEELAAGLDAARRERAAASLPPPAIAPTAPAAAREPSLEETILKNERAAIATLRNLCACQAQIQTTGKIDCDNDGIGEFGTFQETTGSVGVRKGFNAGSPAGSDFSTTGSPVAPAIVSASLANVDGEGRASKNGYMFQIFLPDTQSPARWVHETPGPGLSGGTGQIGVDLAETTWCMYAWPVESGKTGGRVFFVNQSADVLQSANKVARHEGTASFDPRSAFRGEGITSRLAVGTHGYDGDVWKVTN